MSDDAAAMAALKKKFEQRKTVSSLDERGRKERRAMRGRDGRVGGGTSVTKVQLNVRIDERLKDKMTSLADARGFTFEEFLRELVGIYEKRGEQKERVA